MKRSNTVRASLAIILICFVGVMTGIIPEAMNSDHWWVVQILLFAACFRLFILFWQTLADAVECRSLGSVIWHFLFGPLASVLYYLFTKERPSEELRADPGYDHFTRGSHEVEAAEFRESPED